MLRDTIALLQATLEALTNPYVESTPMVTTTVISYITQTSAYCGGIVTSMSNDPVTARGICWSTNPQPTLTDAHTNDGAGVGSFTGLMSGLTPNTTYYARAYATNSLGTAYGTTVSFTTNDITAMAELPTVITSPVTGVIQNHANCGGMVTADGGAPVTARGVCWNTTGNPSITGTHSTDGSGLGEFSSSIAGLTVNTTYYVCAYATNSAGTAYGEVLTFTPGVSCPGTPTVTDYDGNTYHTVQIGTQCWMKENLKTTHYSNGNGIMLGNGVLGSTTVGYYYYPNGDADNKNVYGLLYNWAAAVNGADTSNLVPSGVQGVCPVGWHVPSENEFALLVDYVSENSEYYCGSNQTYIAKALADSVGWRWNSTDSSTYQYNNGLDCFVGNQPSMNNATSFSARPAGWAEPSTSVYANVTHRYFSKHTHFWTTTSMLHYSANYENCRSTYGIGYNSATVATPYYLNGEMHYGFSVRCIKD
ncbi:MAG: fibrobacter succinogenes major paralogous domain-containing protein [Bacteroidales bacterium]|nr:fibrobacter succinogenes major paralogous domain-containing protein [Bacteroidales bacterium]